MARKQAPTLDAEIWAFIRSHRTAGLATTDEQGRPHAVNLWYASDDRHRLYFVSSLTTAHSRHVVRDAHVALTIYGPTDDPMHVHGLQIKGLCVPITPPPEGSDADWRLAWRTYETKFPFVGSDPFFRQAVDSQCFFRVTPTWVRWMDNRKGFGFKVERSLLPKPRARRKAAGRKAAGKKKPARRKA